MVISRIRSKVRIPIPVEILAIFFDLVQPAKEIIVTKEKIPIKKEIEPINLGSVKSLAAIWNG